MSEKPTLRLVRGDAEPEELAALLAVLTARAGGPNPSAAAAPRAGRWGDPAAAVGRSIHPGNGAWRGSGLPR
jgi:hypothetical protein